MNTNINYPIINISINIWDYDIVNELILFDKFYYSNDDKWFNEFLLKSNFVDCNGNVFKISRKIPIKLNFWRRLFTSKRSELIFKELDKTVSLYQLKEIMTERINSLGNGDIEKNWIVDVKNAQSIRELLGD